MPRGPLRLLVVPTGVLRGAARDALLAGLEARGLAGPDALTIRWLEADPMARFSEEVAAFQPDILLVAGTTQSLRARDQAPALPIVAWGVGAAVAGERPPNTTGVTLAEEIYARRLALVRALVPAARKVALAYDDGYAPGRVALRRTRDEARRSGFDTGVYDMRAPDDIERGLERIARDRMDAVLVLNSPILGREDMAAAARRLGLPLFGYDWTTRAGGLASVTPDFRDVARTFADQIARIASGTRADDIPVEVNRGFWTAVNTATAAKLGLRIPERLLATATEIVG